MSAANTMPEQTPAEHRTSGCAFEEAAATPSGRSQLARDYLWNTIASLLSALSTVVMLAVVNRTAGIIAAGIFSLALAIGQQFQTLGMFEVRTFHITDVERRFSFGTYFATRVLTVAAMAAGIVTYCAWTAENPPTFLLIVLLALLRLFDAFEDVFYSELQRSGRLDLGGRASSIRTFTTMVTFCVALMITHSLLWATLVTHIASLIALIWAYVPASRPLFALRPNWRRGPIVQVIRECWALFLGSFISMYLANAPRYAIAHFLDSETQGIFAIIYMPAMAINLLSLFVYRPLVSRIATSWVKREHRQFFDSVRKGLLGTGAAFAIVALTCSLAGPFILRLVFGTDVSTYLLELLILVAAGAFNAASVILFYTLTTMRRQHLLLVAYLAAAVSAMVGSLLLVPTMGLMGACLMYLITIVVLTSTQGLFILLTAHHRMREPRLAPLQVPDTATGTHDDARTTVSTEDT